MKIAFIRNNKVVCCHHPLDLWAISKANLRIDWQKRKEVSDEVEEDWNYNPETDELTSPEE